MIAFLNLRTHLRFINLIATSSKFPFAVAGVSDYHALDLVAMVALSFYPICKMAIRLAKNHTQIIISLRNRMR